MAADTSAQKQCRCALPVPAASQARLRCAPCYLRVRAESLCTGLHAPWCPERAFGWQPLPPSPCHTTALLQATQHRRREHYDLETSEHKFGEASNFAKPFYRFLCCGFFAMVRFAQPSLSDTVSVSSLNPCLQERHMRWLRALGTFCQAVICAAYRIWLPLGA